MNVIIVNTKRCVQYFLYLHLLMGHSVPVVFVRNITKKPFSEGGGGERGRMNHRELVHGLYLNLLV